MTVRTIDEIFRDFVIDGVPASGPFNPYKSDIRDTLKNLLEGISTFPDNRVIRLNNANEGTANNILVSASVAIPSAAYQVLYILNVTQANTGPVTVSGAINRQLVTNTSQPVPSGYLAPGMAVLCIDTGSALRMLSYGDMETIVRDAEAAQTAAEAARDIALDAASNAVAQGAVPIYSTRESIASYEIPAGITAFRTNGFSSVGDGGGALYKRVATEPLHDGKVQSADGSWWELVFSGPVNVKWFGAVGDGVVDDSLVFNAVANLTGSIYIPKGEYLLSNPWIFTDKTVSIKGDGKNISILKFADGAINGISINNPTTVMSVDIYDLSVTTMSTSPTGNAIQIIWPETFEGRNLHKGIISGLRIEGYNTQTMGWLRGIRYVNGCNCMVENCSILGKDTNGTSSSLQSDKTVSQIGIVWDGGVYPVELYIHNTIINCFYYGVYATGAPEGIYVHNCTMLNVRIGVWAVPTIFAIGIGGGSAKYRPWLTVSDCHIATYENAVYSGGMVQSTIHDNLFYGNNNGLQNLLLIYVTDAGGYDVHNNQLYSFATAQVCNGIVFENVADAHCYDNQIGSMGVGLWLKPGSSKVRHHDNTYSAPFSTAAIYDQNISANVAGQRGCLVYSSTAQSLSNNTTTNITYLSEAYDYGDWWSSGAELTVPFDVTRIKITGLVVFAGNSSGFREVNVYVNGSTGYPGAPVATIGGQDTNSLAMSIASPIIAVVPGQKIKLTAFQNSGGVLDVTKSWLAVEVVG